MKRFLSWVVLALASAAFAFVAALVTVLAVRLFFLIYDKAGAIVFWVLVIIEGFTFLWFTIMAISLGGHVVISWSQKVWKSKKGARYIVFGVIVAILYLLVLASLALGIVSTSNPYYSAPYWVVMIIYGIALAVMGKKAAEEDGGPPTKREILEAKLAKLGEKGK